MAKGQHYLWSNLYDGGETDTVRTPNGGERNVILSRNIKTVGDEISESDASSKEEWEAWLEAGVARPYKYPDMPAGSTDSPVVHLQKQLAEAASSQEELLTAQVAGVTSSEEQMVEATSEAKPAASDKK